MRLVQMLELEALMGARVVAGRQGTDREIRWANVVDIPDPLPWVSPGQLLLTTGISWPRGRQEQHQLVHELAVRDLAGVVLAVPKYLAHFPAAAVAAADSFSLPLFEVPWDVPFATITQSVNTTIMAQQYRVIEQAAIIHKELTRAALTAGSVQDLVDTLGRLIDRDITLEDPDGRLLAHWGGSVAVDPVRRATLETGTTPSAVVRYLEKGGHLARIRASQGPLRIPSEPSLSLAGRVVCPIWLRGELVGTVWIVEGDEELSELHMHAAEHAAVVAALHIATQRQLATVELRLGATFLDALLEGRFEGSPNNLERARLVGFSPEAVHRVGIVALQVPLPLSREAVVKRDRMAEQIRDRLQRLGGIPVTSTRLNHVVFMLGERVDPSGVCHLRPGEPIVMVLGRAHRGVDGVRRSYQEVAAIIGQIEPGGVRRYEDMLVWRVLHGDADARDAFLDQLFGPLRRARGGDALVKSLVTMAEHGFQRRQAAAALHVHSNTLRYRLDRASDLLHLDLTDPEVRFQMQLAARLVSLPHNLPG
ncbi:MAG: PucR family transcriptional regulator [Candidatus Dormibacteria bacterium]